MVEPVGSDAAATPQVVLTICLDTYVTCPLRQGRFDVDHMTLLGPSSGVPGLAAADERMEKTVAIAGAFWKPQHDVADSVGVEIASPPEFSFGEQTAVNRPIGYGSS